MHRKSSLALALVAFLAVSCDQQSPTAANDETVPWPD